MSRSTRKRMLYVDAERWIMLVPTRSSRRSASNRVRRARNQFRACLAPDGAVEA